MQDNRTKNCETSECRWQSGDITIVIPTVGRAMLMDCLESIRDGDTMPAQVVIVDQGRNASLESSIRSQSWKGLRINYVPSYDTGRAAGLNSGLAHVRTQFVAFTDDDCVVQPDWIASMLQRLRGDPGNVVTGRVLAEGDGCAVATVNIDQTRVYSRPSLMFDLLAGGNMGAALATFHEVGHFDEDCRLHAAEDRDWSYRVLRSNKKIVYAPEVIVSHKSWRNSNEQWERYKNYARSHGAFYGKYIMKGDVFIALKLLVHLIRSCKRWFLGSIRGDKERARNGRAYCMNLIPGAIAAMLGDEFR